MAKDNFVYYDTSTASDSYAYPSDWGTSDQNDTFYIPPKKKVDNSFNTEFIKNINSIIEELGMTAMNISIAAFTKYDSDAEIDIIKLTHRIPCYLHIMHPIKHDPQQELINLFSYDLAIILDVLENVASKMARANIIREALTSLKLISPSYLIIKSKAEEEVDKFREIFLSEDELTSLAIYAGATNIKKLKCTKEMKSPIIVAREGG